MLEQEKPTLELVKSDDKDLDEVIDKSSLLVPLDEEEQQIVQSIINAPDQRELEFQFQLFNQNQSKKNAVRVIKLNKLLGKIEDQAIKRFTKRPDNISNRELLEYMQVVANQIDRSQKMIDTLKDTPAIKVTNPSEVNINIGSDLTRDNKTHVIEAIQELLKQINDTAQQDVIEVDSEEVDTVTEDSAEDPSVSITTAEEERNSNND